MRKLHWILLGTVFFMVNLPGSIALDLSDDQVIAEVNRHRPLLGAKIPGHIKERLGTTHVGGKYYLTEEPFLLEGSNKVGELGYGAIKLWFRKDSDRYYSFNSEWNLKPDLKLAELARHPYWKSCFEMPFSTFALSLAGAGMRTTGATAAEEEEEIYQLTKFLLETYRNRDVTFILHNWEGDWILRGGTGPGSRWSKNPAGKGSGGIQEVPVPDDVPQRVQAMVKWFNARQSGVDRARAEITDTKCRVYHAIEANRVMDSMDGIPGIVNSVLPLVEVDMVSWSSYDGLDATGVKLYRGIQYIKKNMRPTPYMNGQRVVFIGEIGIPEQSNPKLVSKDQIADRWDAYLGACLALDVPYIFQWELYCNEPKDRTLKQLAVKRTADEMRGFWLVRPDGSKSHAGEYFDEVLRNAGKRIR